MLKNVSDREIRIRTAPTDEVRGAPFYWEVVGYYESAKQWFLEDYGWSETVDIAFNDAKIGLKRLNEKYPMLNYNPDNEI